jgi:hypothetical protein
MVWIHSPTNFVAVDDTVQVWSRHYQLAHFVHPSVLDHWILFRSAFIVCTPGAETVPRFRVFDKHIETIELGELLEVRMFCQEHLYDNPPEIFISKQGSGDYIVRDDEFADRDLFLDCEYP